MQTPEQFYDWLTLIDRAVTHKQEAHFRAHVASLMGHLEICEGLIKHINEVDDRLAEMYEEWWRVEENGRMVKEGCERVVEERVSESACNSFTFSSIIGESGPAARSYGRYRWALGVFSGAGTSN